MATQVKPKFVLMKGPPYKKRGYPPHKDYLAAMQVSRMIIFVFLAEMEEKMKYKFANIEKRNEARAENIIKVRQCQIDR